MQTTFKLFPLQPQMREVLGKCDDVDVLKNEQADKSIRE